MERRRERARARERGDTGCTIKRRDVNANNRGGLQRCNTTRYPVEALLDQSAKGRDPVRCHDLVTKASQIFRHSWKCLCRSMLETR